MGTNITGIGNANAIGFKSRVTGGTYFPPELKDALVGVWSAYGKSNDSTDRNIIKNKIKDRGGDFVISNAAFKLNSGFGKYETELSNTRIWTQSKETTSSPFSSNYNGLSGWIVFANTELTNSVDMPSFKIQVKGLLEGQELIYRYYDSTGQTNVYSMTKDGKYTLPADVRTAKPLTSNTSGFQIVKNETNTITITQIPSFEGAFVTDGIDDLITSTKTVQEMGITDEITVVSMIHKISSDNNWTNLIGELKEDHTFVANRATNTDKTGIYGYTYNYVGDAIVINNILGDKNDYIVRTSTSLGLDNKYYVTGFRSAGIIQNISQIAWYWTFIANRVLTEDEINLVIEKYNLDRPGEIVKPQVYYNIKKQKISNDNHSAFDDKLIDYSGNGYDAKLYNFGWKEDSGIGKYETDFTDWKKSFKVTSFDSESIKFTSDVSWVLLYHPSSIGEDIPSFKVRIKLYGKGTLYYNYITQEGKYTNVAVKSEIFETPICYNTKYTGEKGVNVGFTLGVTSGECSGTITQIPEYENALVLDGVDDYGKVTGLPILKDYTVAADYIRTFAKESAQDSPILSKSKVQGAGAFLFNFLDANSRQATFSFGKNTGLTERVDDSKRSIYYQSKYINNGNDITAGTAIDYEDMWLGTYRDNTSNFFTGALYFAMLFPYSLSEFLLERQIKKARTGTLYPNQVEFRPIIPEDENITKIDYFVVNSGVWTVIKPGDYVDVGARIVLNVYTKLPYKIEKVSSLAFTGMSVEPSTGLNIFDIKGYIKDKTPQKIKITLAVNEDIVQWNPTITSNLLDSFTASSWYLNGWDNTITTGTWIKKTDRVFFKATFKTELYGLETATFGGAECVVSKADNWSDSKNIWDIRMLGTVGDLSQVFNLDVYELIRFEDIVQPFPTVFRLLDTTNNHEYTYGDKLKVGSKVKFASFSNLLPELYQPNGTGQYNGVTCVSGTVITVEKQMVFSWSASFTYLKTNAPKCIFSPSKLRMPNESYRYLGYIPDISGNGNNGVFNNFAFSKMSGVNGYLEDFTTLRDYGIKGIVRTDSKIYLDESFDYDKGFWLGYTNVPSPAYKVKISGIPETGMLTYTGGVWLNLTNGINELPARTNTAENHGFVVQSPNLDWSNLVIEQIPEYEGSICFDGVDDYITIPTLSEGGKQVLMKVNWQKQDTMLYNQNPGQDNFAIFTNDYNNNNLVVAYASRNNGNTYIDGVVNNNILATQLKGITHNIVATNNNIDATITPIIGSNKNHDNFFAQMALYDFMLFDEISTDEEIKELNNIVGIEGDYVQKPSYYWDAYGKSNLDVDKGYIKDQVSLQLNNDTTNNNSLENFNFGYEGMSGYNGYPVIFGANKTWKNKAPEGPNSYICTINANKYNITQILLSNAWTYSYIKENGELTKYNKDVGSFKIKVTGLKSEIPLRYSYLSSTDATVTSNITIKSDGTYELPKSFANDGSLIDNYGWIGFSFTRVSVDIPEIITDVNITIEILPEYKNGLVYDGVDDYSENASIPLLSDYTYIFKRTLLNKKYNSASIFKGSNQQSGGGAFICDYNSVEPDLLTQGYSFGAGLYVDSLNADSIVYGTRGSVNGTKITAGNNTDTEGLTVGKWRAYKEMVFYKLFLYPRTVNMLSINMVKNMMEEDGIIDLTSKLFTDKYTGDFYEMDFNNDFLIGN